MPDVLVLFSGGKDSCLTALRLAHQKYTVKLINFDNGCTLEAGNVKVTADKLQTEHPNISFIGVESTAGIFNELRGLFADMKPSRLTKYGDITFSQLNCLTCRTAMYCKAIEIACREGIAYIAEGARRSQLFAIEQDCMLEEFTCLCKAYNKQLLLPVVDVVDDWAARNEMLTLGFVPKVYEAMCLLGVPMDGMLAQDALVGATRFYKQVVNPVVVARINSMIGAGEDL